MNDELERIRQFRVDEPDASDEAIAHAQAALNWEIDVATDARSHRRRRRAARVWWMPGIAVAAALAAGLFFTWPFRSGGGPSVSTALAATLNRLALIAARGPSLIPHGSQFLYVASASDAQDDAGAGGKECVTYAPERRQIWIGANGSGLLRESSGLATFTSAADRSICHAMAQGASSPSGPSTTWFAPGCLSIGPNDNVNALSTDPRKLLMQMRRADGGPPGAAEDFVHVGDFLRETDARPDLRAALYRAALLIPGVRLLGEVRDHLGRPGLGIAYEDHELIFNQRTAALQAEHTIGQPDWTVYLQSRVVDTLPRRSPLPLTPPCINGGGYDHQTPTGDVETGAQP